MAPLIKQHAESLQYDPRTRPWFQAATQGGIHSAESRYRPQEPHWTEPYVFFTTKDLGITVSKAIPNRKDVGVTTVVAFDMLLQDITQFTTRKQPTQNGKLLVLTSDAKLVALPSEEQFATPTQWKKWFMKPIVDIDQPYAKNAEEAFSFTTREPQIRRFESNGAPWWGAAKPFQLGKELTLWIVVLLPESDLHEQLSER